MPELIGCAVRDHVATVTLDSLTMPPGFFPVCERTFRELAATPDLRAVVVCAGGKAFNYGLDLAAAAAELGPLFQSGGARQRSELLQLIRRTQRAFTAIEECPVPVIAAVHGACIGGGLDLITACDLRVAARDAVFSLRETRVAIVADLGSLQRLPRLVGRGVARELAYTGKDIDAERALRIGLINEVYETREQMLSGAMALATEIAANPPLTVRGVKDVLQRSEESSIAVGLDYVAAWNAAFLSSEDLMEAMAAFAGKRSPSFKGQ
jgi:enoyl-CoA hydratase